MSIKILSHTSSQFAEAQQGDNHTGSFHSLRDSFLIMPTCSDFAAEDIASWIWRGVVTSACPRGEWMYYAGVYFRAKDQGEVTQLTVRFAGFDNPSACEAQTIFVTDLNSSKEIRYVYQTQLRFTTGHLGQPLYASGKRGPTICAGSGIRGHTKAQGRKSMLVLIILTASELRQKLRQCDEVSCLTVSSDFDEAIQARRADVIETVGLDSSTALYLEVASLKTMKSVNPSKYATILASATTRVSSSSLPRPVPLNRRKRKRRSAPIRAVDYAEDSSESESDVDAAVEAAQACLTDSEEAVPEVSAVTERVHYEFPIPIPADVESSEPEVYPNFNDLASVIGSDFLNMTIPEWYEVPQTFAL